MTDDKRRVPIKVKVVDKRKKKPNPKIDEGFEPDETAPSSLSGKPSSSAPLDEGTASSESPERGEGSIPAQDAADSGDSPAARSGSVADTAPEAEDAHDYLDDLRRLQAEFDNFRKRTFKERQQLEARGKRQMVEHLLPVLDNFERAISHGEGGAGVELVFKELRSALERDGLAEIEAEGKPFDPQIHEAVESIEDTEVDQATVTQVYRRGYTFGSDVVRPAMVVVARPAELETPVDDAGEQAGVAGGG
jgi:molecular chaperone GrpE